ncbi:23S rRNA (adenine(2503)-C(2))-methyltransferase RlmN [Anaerobacillus isosaccharinicus]|uniref:Probable dual-specificity RNA methyltransferase RlmN n=1 Tax=Anaerobacillus isosaccharinicus TaxID=1532552 RepID=A0A1S2L4Z1_9BACI|nr:23S rRNA (adenine(2503)-C(2))-methyltransferase RlmN [Anaerobacillus isosaccharinicus]MBA5588718.1 23S rRNA (adenine(2503)-C(2))-methyltransferase RlmN [Anaerobacillus isosaccharinicus]QOY37880.1 23S rRNA (adenine(2503)-C(2))-methyltransferase RlmN [Anaerobacillus isosaccharinicus]
MNKPSIYGLTLEELTAWLLKFGHKKGRTLQVWDWLYGKRVTDFSEMVDVHESCIKLLEDHFSIHTMTEHIKQEASDGTIKFLFKLHDGNLIETVLMRQKYGLSVCVTTQVGCNIGCSFCASGLLTKTRDLTSGEIVEQIMMVQHDLDKKGAGGKVTHVVVMGIGEPFDNFNNMVSFLQIIKDQKGLEIAPKNITVSTSGLSEKIYEFTDLNLQVHLAISLHAPNNELRTKIMKINKAIPLEKLMDAMDYYIDKTNRRVMLEYIMLKGINDQEQQALELAELIGDRGKKVSVNLIPYNPVDEHDQYQRSLEDDVFNFHTILRDKGINSSIRQEHGTDIDAACGQLRSKQIKK